jgi:hypothetical protein
MHAVTKSLLRKSHVRAVTKFKVRSGDSPFKMVCRAKLAIF